MSLLSYFNTSFASKHLTSGVRFTALMLLTLYSPLMIVAFVFIYLVPVTVPAIILYLHYWAIYLDDHNLKGSLRVWYGTMIYNLFLMVLVTSFLGLEAWPLLVLLSGIVGAGAVMARITHEKIAETTEAHPETV